MMMLVAANSETISPALLALLPLCGVVLTIIAGLIGAWVQGRREHSKWLRERRYEAFVAVAAGVQRWRSLHAAAFNDDGSVKSTDAQRELGELYETLIDEAVPLWVLGPSAVDSAAAEMRSAFASRDREREDKAVRAFLHATRSALRIRD